MDKHPFEDCQQCSKSLGERDHGCFRFFAVGAVVVGVVTGSCSDNFLLLGSSSCGGKNMESDRCNGTSAGQSRSILQKM